MRKLGKLPYKTDRVEYALEYGKGVLEAHVDAVRPGEKVAIVDDLLATGGTAWGAAQLLSIDGTSPADRKSDHGTGALGALTGTPQRPHRARRGGLRNFPDCAT